MTRRIVLSAVLLLAVVAGCFAAELTFRVSDEQQSYLNALHAPENQEHREALEASFLQLDTNVDGQLDEQEMHQLAQDGSITHLEHTMLQAFDADGSGDVSQAEFTMAPYQLNLLQLDSSLDTEVESRRFTPSLEEQSAEAAFEGRTVDTPLRRLKSRAQSDSMLAEVASSTRQIPTDAAEGTHTKKASKRGSAPLQVSVFGVPSVADEECVMCQYFVQRIQAGVADRLENGPSANAAAPAEGGAAGLAGAASAAQALLKIRNTNSALSKKPGGRGIVRVVAEDLIQALCAVDKMPLLFNPYCSGIVEPNAINAVRKGIFFNIPTVEVCSQAALCRDDSYLNTNAAVHATKTSLFLNGQRGICGMLGGAKDKGTAREGVMINAICAAHGAMFQP